MKYQELQYLRDELNQRISYSFEHTNKTVNMVLLVWSGVLVLLGKDMIKYIGPNIENIPVYFMVATILFISNLVLFYTARKYYNNADSMDKLAAYITVFYEKLPSATVKVGENFSWELAIFETMVPGKHEKNIIKRNIEYMALTIVSVMLMVILLVIFFVNIPTGDRMEEIVSVILLLVCVIYFGFSVYWLCILPKFTFLKDDYGMKVRHLKSFIDFAIKTKYYDKDKIIERFGDDFWNKVCNQDVGVKL